jgi:hypothetical protein
MGMTLDQIRVPRREFELRQADWSEHLRVIEAPASLPWILEDVPPLTVVVGIARIH